MQRLFDIFEAAGNQLYLVGGAVRDHCMGQPLAGLKDLDFTTDARPDQIEAVLRRARLPRYDVGRRFGTIGTVLRGAKDAGFPKDVQITTFRAAHADDPSADGFGRNLQADLALRDVRFNSMALDRSGRVIDPFEGRTDLAQRRIRAVGEPQSMLEADPLRLLRIGRFVSALGFEPTPELRDAMAYRAVRLLTVSRERWLQEMNKLLVGQYASDALELLRTTGVLAVILPEVVALHDAHLGCAVRHQDLWAHTLTAVTGAPPTAVLRWAALVLDIGKLWTRRVEDGRVRFRGHEAHRAMLFDGIAARFKLDRRSARRIDFLVANHWLAQSYRSDWSDAAVRRMVSQAGDHLADLIDLARADRTTASARCPAQPLPRADELTTRIDALERSKALRPQLPTGLGRAVMAAFEVSQGPHVGRRVAAVRAAILDGLLPTAPSTEDCIAFLAASLPQRE